MSWAGAGSSGKTGPVGDLPGKRQQVGRFVRATAAWIEGATEQTAKWDVGAVLSVVADAAGEGLTRRVLLQLPAGYELLFGCPEPT
ncbi:DUF2267 domain-containing protein [Streptomyces sp. NPDC057580]|uniref:DUF2267 domain-containing protein n=1 Tax=Streptomyces sp. NPDC057580 TaxID=3346173 RepID=UPI0036A9B9D1